MSPVHVVALVKGAVEGDAFQHFGSLLGFAAHRAAARLGLVTIDEADHDGVQPGRVLVTERGRRFYADAGQATLPAGRANHWGDAAAEAVRLLDVMVVSGGAAGIDRMAAEEARRRGLGVVEHRPGGRSWRHFRARNLRIVADCDELVRIADPRSRSYGSGWSRDRAREAGRPTFEYTVTSRPPTSDGRAAGLLRGTPDA